MADRSQRLQLGPSPPDGNEARDHDVGVDPRARSFFLANKDLFEYDKYVGNAAPFDPACSSPSREPSLSFLDRYRACDEQHTSANDDASHLLAVPALASSILSISLPSVASCSPPRAIYQVPASFSISLSLVPSPGDAGGYCHNYQLPHHHYNGDQQLSLPSSYQSRLSPPKSLGSPAGRQRFTLEMYPAGPLSVLETSPTHDQRYGHLENARSSLQHRQTVATSSLVYNGSPPRQQQPGGSLLGPAKATTFQMPVVSDLLIDSSARRQQLAQRQVDEPARIQLLVGSKCVGRVSAATRSLPASIRKRLKASTGVAERRERLYNVLLQDYHRLAGM